METTDNASLESIKGSDSKDKYRLVVFELENISFGIPISQCLKVIPITELFFTEDKLLFNGNQKESFFSYLKMFFLYGQEAVPLIDLSKKLSIYDNSQVRYVLCLSFDTFVIGCEICSGIDIVSYTKDDIFYDDKSIKTDYITYMVLQQKGESKRKIYMLDFSRL